MSSPRSLKLLRDEEETGDRLLFVCFLVAAGAWCAWASWMPLPVRVASAAAAVAPEERVHPVGTDVAGRVARVHVSLGDTVDAGEVLVELEAEHHTAEVAAAEAVVAHLRARNAASDREGAEELAQLRAEVAAARLELTSATEKARGERLAAGFAGRHYEQGLRLVEMGLVSSDELLRREAEAARADSGAAIAELAAARAAETLAAAQRHLAARRESFAGLAAELSRQLSDAEERVDHLRHEADARRVRAPVSGTIGSLVAARPGSQLEAGATVAVIVPQHSEEVVLARIEARHAGVLKANQTALVRTVAGSSQGSARMLPARVLAVGLVEADGLIPVELRLQSDEQLGATTPVRVEVEVRRAPLLTALIASLRG